MSERTENWNCSNTTRESSKQAITQAQDELQQGGQLSMEDEVDVDSLTAGYCTIRGCWDVVASNAAIYSGTGTYGYGKTFLGNVKLYYKVTNTGLRTRSYPFWFSSSRGTRDTDLYGERLYLSDAYPGGNRVTPAQIFSRDFTARSAGISAQWPSTVAPTTYANTAWMSVVHGARWQDVSSNYPGTWSMWAKSNKAYRNSNNAMTFVNDGILPTSPAGSKYYPY